MRVRETQEGGGGECGKKTEQRGEERCRGSQKETLTAHLFYKVFLSGRTENEVERRDRNDMREGECVPFNM